jgi:DNA-binding PadR family transcriptional regulator
MSGADFINKYGLFSGTLYPILQRLEDAGWCRSYWEAGDPSELGRPNRRYYELTPVGQRRTQEALSDRRVRKFFGSGELEPIGA